MQDGVKKMKAILVVDKPESCTSCLLGIYHKRWFCLKTLKDIDITDRYNIPSWCPLKPMPQKKEVEVNEIEDIMRTEYSIEDIYTNKYVATIRLATDKLISIGWNACLEELEKC